MVTEIEGAEATSDPVWGVEAIAEIVKRTPRVTFDLLNKGQIPGRKIGGRWMVDRAVLHRFLKGEAA